MTFPDFMLWVCADRRIAWSILIWMPCSGRVEFDVMGFPGIVADPVISFFPVGVV